MLLNVKEKWILQDNLSTLHLQSQNIFLLDNQYKHYRSRMFQPRNVRCIRRRDSHNLNNTRDTFCHNLQYHMCKQDNLHQNHSLCKLFQLGCDMESTHNNHSHTHPHANL